jgi:hypothetical protein
MGIVRLTFCCMFTSTNKQKQRNHGKEFKSTKPFQMQTNRQNGIKARNGTAENRIGKAKCILSFE